MNPKIREVYRYLLNGWHIGYITNNNFGWCYKSVTWSFDDVYLADRFIRPYVIK